MGKDIGPLEQATARCAARLRWWMSPSLSFNPNSVRAWLTCAGSALRGLVTSAYRYVECRAQSPLVDHTARDPIRRTGGPVCISHGSDDLPPAWQSCARQVAMIAAGRCASLSVENGCAGGNLRIISFILFSLARVAPSFLATIRDYDNGTMFTRATSKSIASGIAQIVVGVARFLVACSGGGPWRDPSQLFLALEESVAVSVPARLGSPVRQCRYRRQVLSLWVRL